MSEASADETEDEVRTDGWNTFGMDPPGREEYEDLTRDWLMPSDLGVLPNVLMVIIAEYGSTLECHFANAHHTSCYVRVVDFDAIGPPIPLSDFHSNIHQNMKNIRLCASVHGKSGIFDQLSDMRWACRSSYVAKDTYFSWVGGLKTLGFPDDSFIRIDDDPRYGIYGGTIALYIYGLERYEGRLMLCESMF